MSVQSSNIESIVEKENSKILISLRYCALIGLYAREKLRRHIRKDINIKKCKSLMITAMIIYIVRIVGAKLDFHENENSAYSI